MKTVTVDVDVGVVAGKGYVVIVVWDDNPEIVVGDIVTLSDKPGLYVVQSVDVSCGTEGWLPTGTLVVTEFEGEISEALDSLADAEKYVLAKRDDGVTCPCCGQYCKVYPRSLNAPMARFLIWLVKEYEARSSTAEGNTWISVNDGPLIQNRKGGGDFAKLRYWGLIEQMANDDETKRSSGYWRPTQTGIDFVHDKIAIPKKVSLYLNTPVGFSEERITIREALGTKFDYRELMSK